MIPYDKMYYELFNVITDAVRLIENGEAEEAKELLKKAQRITEEMYISAT